MLNVMNAFECLFFCFSSLFFYPAPCSYLMFPAQFWQVFADAHQLRPLQLYPSPLSINVLPHQALNRTQSSPASTSLKSSTAEPLVKHLFTTGRERWRTLSQGLGHKSDTRLASPVGIYITLEVGFLTGKVLPDIRQFHRCSGKILYCGLRLPKSTIIENGLCRELNLCASGLVRTPEGVRTRGRTSRGATTTPAQVPALQRRIRLFLQATDPVHITGLPFLGSFMQRWVSLRGGSCRGCL